MSWLYVALTCLAARGVHYKKQLDDADLALDRPLFIYFHDTSCDGCVPFNEVVDTISTIDTRKVNYSQNQEMAMRFFVYYVPHFAVRAHGKTYVITPHDKDELLDILEKQLWKDKAPLKWYLDPCFILVRCAAKALCITHNMYFYLQGYMVYVPRQLIYMIYGIIIGYLVFSIKEAIAEIIRDAKSKTE